MKEVKTSVTNSQSNRLRPLPEGWKWVTLGDVCKPPQYGWTTRAASQGDLHLLRTTDITSGKIDWKTVPYCTEKPTDTEKYLLYDGDIVITRAGSVGYSYLVKNPRPAVFASYLIRFRPLINERFIAYFLQSPLYWESISEKSLGIAIPNVNATKLRQIYFPLAPTGEQEQIVARLEELLSDLEAGVAALERVRVGAKRYKASVLKAACEGKLFGEKGRESGKLPEEWRWVTLGDLADRVTSGSRGWAKYYADIGDLFVRVGNFNRLSSEIDLTKVVMVNAPDTAEGNRTRLKLNDILITITADVGMVGVVDDRVIRQWENAYINQHVGLVRLANIDFADFIAYALASDPLQKQFKEKQYGATKKGFNLDDLKSLEIPFPPLEEQRRIVAEVERRLELVRAVEAAAEAGLKRAGRLRQAELRSAFEGRL